MTTLFQSLRRRGLGAALLASLLGAGSLTQPALAQNTRLADYNRIGWYTNTTTLRFAERWSGHFEYQFRRDNWITAWQQSLLRTGLNYKVSDALTVRLGYAWVETFPYGDVPIQGAGVRFPEHRLYEAATLGSPPQGRVEISHRFMLEQRYFGRFLTPPPGTAVSSRPDEWVYVNRARYLLRLQMPLGKSKMEDKTPYLAAYDEIMIGFGKNVNENIFDQNRLGLLLGYRFTPQFRVEGGYFQQVLQLPREIGGRNLLQDNQGIILNTVVNLDLRRPATQ